jgi:predicted small lipoprotein YifL
MKNRITVMFLALTIATLTACGQSGNTSNAPASSTPSEPSSTTEPAESVSSAIDVADTPQEAPIVDLEDNTADIVPDTYLTMEEAAAIGIERLTEVFNIDLNAENVTMSYGSATGNMPALFLGVWNPDSTSDLPAYWFQVNAQTGNIRYVQHVRSLEKEDMANPDNTMKDLYKENPENFLLSAEKVIKELRGGNTATDKVWLEDEYFVASGEHIAVVGTSGAEGINEEWFLFSKHDKALLGVIYNEAIPYFEEQWEASSEETEPSSARTDFEVDFFGENAGSPMTVSLVLPEGLTRGGGVIVDENEDWVGSVELHPVTSDQPFDDIDEQYANTAASEMTTEELTIAGYPAKLYRLRFEALGNGDRAAGTQYLYYIMVDDTYVLLLFGPKETSDVTEDMIQSVVASCEIA